MARNGTRTLRAIQNPVRSARVVGHGKNTLSIIVETTRGEYRWDIKPIFPFEIKRWISRFKSNWKEALRSVIREASDVSSSKVNSGWEWHKRSVGTRKVWFGFDGERRALIEKNVNIFEWDIRKAGTLDPIAEGISKTLKGAIRKVETLKGSPRMLFNPSVRKNWLVRHRGRDNDWAEWRKEIGDVVGIVFEDKETKTCNISVWRKGKRTFFVPNAKGALWEVWVQADKLMKRASGDPRMLFNSEYAKVYKIMLGGRVFRTYAGRKVAERALVTLTKRLRKQRGWTGSIELPVLTPSTKKKPRMLFNKVRR